MKNSKLNLKGLFIILKLGDMNKKYLLAFIQIFIQPKNILVEAVSSVVGSTVTLQCPLLPTNRNNVIWFNGSLPLSDGNYIIPELPNELKTRLSVIVVNGKYPLTISNLKKTDQGQYQCVVGGTLDPLQTLTVKVGPTSVGFENMVNNKLQGTEGKDLRIRCTAVGGDPPPNVLIQIGTSDLETSGTGGVKEHLIPAINRSYDGTPVSCRTDYPGVQYEPLTDTAYIYLNLKPLPPIFSLYPIITEDTKPLVLTCTSTGSRPAPTERIWLLGDSNTDITSHSTIVSQSPDSTKADTYIATSTLTYTVHKQYNGKYITCGFKNTAVSGNDFVMSSRQIEVKYAPKVTVQNKTFQQSETNRVLQCTLFGNPANYTFMKWQHISKYGQLIRSLNSVYTQSLPVVPEEIRYQDTGEYVCTASNGIVNNQNQVYQTGSGYVISRAQPFFTNGSSQTVFVQTPNDVTIEVSVYSEPKFTGLTWYKDVSPISHGSKYVMSNSDDIITTAFHGVNVQVDGYKLTLTIKNLQENDYTNYTVEISNGVGQPVYHAVLLKSVGPPDRPTHFNVTNIQTNSITVKWKPGFDGGSEQRFVIQYRKFGTSLWNLEKVESMMTIFQDDKSWFTLDDLTEGTCYALRMYAENIYDSSSFTDVLEIATGHKAETQNASQSDVAGVAGGFSAVIIIMLGVILVLLWRFNACKMSECHHKRTETDTTQHYMDVSDDDRSKHTSSERTITSPVAEYEELGLRDQPNIYSQVDNGQQHRDPASHFYSNEA